MISSFKPIGANGFTLIEALITIIVMSIGLLGLSAMQTTSIRFTYDSYLRTQSSFLADDLFDRMRANPTINYDDETQSTATNCVTTNCDANTIMQYDYTKWNEKIDELFPNSEVTVTPSADLNTYTITFLWDSRTDDGTQVGADDQRKTFTYEARIR